MSAITWSEALALQQPRMDQTHREFVELLQGLERAIGSPTSELVDQLGAMLGHTEAHFAQEERWMLDIGFAKENCHFFQHQQVLQVLREVLEMVRDKGEAKLLPVLVDELGRWFVGHAQMMDGALAQTMVERGYDPDTGRLVQPLAADTAPITGCGGTSCS